MKTTTKMIFLALCGLFVLLGQAFSMSISGQERAMMIEAARVDLYAQLARQIKGLQVTDSTLVANHVTEESLKSGYIEAVVKGVELGEPMFIDDICIINGKITLKQVVENLTTITSQSGRNSTVNFSSLERKNEFRVVRAQGTGTLRAPEEDVAATSDFENEAGLAGTLQSLSGSGQEKLGAIEAARIDALAQLARQIKGLRLSDTSLVNNMALDARWTQTSTNALIKGAQIKRFSSPAPDLVACVAEIHIKQVVENVERSFTAFSDGSSVSYEDIKRLNPKIVTFKATGYGAVGKGNLNGMGGSTPDVIGSIE